MKIAHISDIHVGGLDFIEDLGDNVVAQVNKLGANVLVITGDLTNDGYLYEYELAKKFIDRFDTPEKIIVPGNHDARNVGYELFEEIFGLRWKTYKKDRIVIVAGDSTEPDIDDGHIGRGNYNYMIKNFSEGDFKIFAIHHHLIPIPGTGRERNIPVDSGDVLKLLVEAKVDLVLCGHKHMPWIWKLENTYMVVAGTATTSRLKARVEQSFKLIEIDKKVKIWKIMSRTGAKSLMKEHKI